MNDKNKNAYEQVQRLDIAEVMAAEAPPQVDTLASLLLKIKIAKYLTVYPDWVEGYVIPPGTEPSMKSPAACWIAALAMRRAEKVHLHPANAVETLLTVSDVKVIGQDLQYVDEKRQPVLIKNTRGYHIIESDNSTSRIAAAHVADCVGYYAKANGADSYEDSFSVDAITRLGFIKVSCVRLRKMLSKNVKNPVMARDLVYRYCLAQVDHAIKFCNDLCLQNSNFASSSPEALALYNELRKIHPNMPAYESVVLPLPSKQVTLKIDDMERFYHYLFECHKNRGQDGGIGVITNGYIRGCCTRSITKAETHFLDIRQLSKMYGTNNIMVVGYIPELVRRMCISNGISIIDPTATTKGKKDIHNATETGIYSQIGREISYGVYYSVESKLPTLRDKVFEHEPLNVDHILQSADKKSACLFRATKVHFHPDMCHEPIYKKVSFLPTALPHNGMVMLASPKIVSYPIDELISRASEANSVRNNFVVVKRSWALLDPMQRQVGYMDPYTIPRMLTHLAREPIDYKAYMVESKADQAVLDTAPITVDIRTLKPERKITPDYLIGDLYGLMCDSGNVYDTFISIFKTWDDKNGFAQIAALKRMGMTEIQAVNALLAGYPRHEDVMSKAYAHLVKLRTEVPPEPPKPPLPERDPRLDDDLEEPPKPPKGTLRNTDTDDYADLDT